MIPWEKRAVEALGIERAPLYNLVKCSESRERAA